MDRPHETNQMPMEKDEEKILLQFGDFISYLLKNVKYLIATGLAALLLTLSYVNIYAVPTYEATALLYVVNSDDSAINLADLQIGSYLASDYLWVFKTWEVNQMVINNLQLPYTVAQIQDHLTIVNPSNTRLLLITFESPDPKQAARVANEYAAVSSQYISDHMRTDKPTILSVALEPANPTHPKKVLIVGLGVLGSVFVAACLLLVKFVMDDKIRMEEDVWKYLGAPPLAVIPKTDPENALWKSARGRKK